MKEADGFKVWATRPGVYHVSPTIRFSGARSAIAATHAFRRALAAALPTERTAAFGCTGVSGESDRSQCVDTLFAWVPDSPRYVHNGEELLLPCLDGPRCTALDAQQAGGSDGE